MQRPRSRIGGRQGFASRRPLRRANGVQMDPLEMPRCFVLLGIADGAECVIVSSETRRSDGPANAIAQSAKYDQSPCPRSLQRGHVVENEANTLQIDQTVGELVLDSLKLSDWLSELLPLLGVGHSQFKGAARGAMGTRQQSRSRHRPKIMQTDVR